MTARPRQSRLPAASPLKVGSPAPAPRELSPQAAPRQRASHSAAVPPQSACHSRQAETAERKATGPRPAHRALERAPSQRPTPATEPALMVAPGGGPRGPVSGAPRSAPPATTPRFRSGRSAPRPFPGRAARRCVTSSPRTGLGQGLDGSPQAASPAPPVEAPRASEAEAAPRAPWRPPVGPGPQGAQPAQPEVASVPATRPRPRARSASRRMAGGRAADAAAWSDSRAGSSPRYSLHGTRRPGLLAPRSMTGWRSNPGRGGLPWRVKALPSSPRPHAHSKGPAPPGLTATAPRRTTTGRAAERGRQWPPRSRGGYEAGEIAQHRTPGTEEGP